MGHPATSAYQRAASPRSTTWGQPRWLPRSCCSSSASGRTALSAGLLRVHARSYIHAPSPRAVPVLGQPVQIPCHAGWPSHLRWLLVTTVVPAHTTCDVRSRVSLQVVTRPSQADCPWLACYRMRSSTWAVVVFPDSSPLLVASCSRTTRRKPIYEGERCSLMHQRGVGLGLVGPHLHRTTSCLVGCSPPSSPSPEDQRRSFAAIVVVHV